MKLSAVIRDKEAWREHVVLCEFKNKDGDKVFVENVIFNNVECFKVLVDEGYLKTFYHYPVNRYFITDLEVYRD